MQCTMSVITATILQRHVDQNHCNGVRQRPHWIMIVVRNALSLHPTFSAITATTIASDVMIMPTAIVGDDNLVE
jgi:hypothetical protein